MTTPAENLVLANQAGDARRADNASRNGRAAFLAQTGGDLPGNMRTGFARIHADQDARRLALTPQIRAQAASHPEEGVIVQRILAWNTANAVGPE